MLQAELEPHDRFDKFTERARLVLSLASNRADSFRHYAITPNHLALGILDEGNGLAVGALVKLGVNLEELLSEVAQATREGYKETSEVGLTSRSHRGIALAVDAARSLHNHYLGTEHLLLGIVAEGEETKSDIETDAAVIFKKHGVNAESLRSGISEFLSSIGVPEQFVPLEVSRRIRVILRGWEDLLNNPDTDDALRDKYLQALEQLFTQTQGNQENPNPIS